MCAYNVAPKRANKFPYFFSCPEKSKSATPVAGMSRSASRQSLKPEAAAAAATGSASQSKQGSAAQSRSGSRLSVRSAQQQQEVSLNFLKNYYLTKYTFCVVLQYFHIKTYL